VGACLLALVLVASFTPSVAAQTLNMSRDLKALGIADQNMVPDNPALDARPLFQKAVEYVQNSAIQTITVDPGAYYFLTSQSPFDYLVIPFLSDVTIDLAGSTIYLKDFYPAGLHVYYPERLTLRNFTIDYLNPPYTHVQLTSVDAANRVLHYAPLPGWPDPSIFSAYASASEISNVVAVPFRNNRIVPGMSRMPLQGPVGGGALRLFQNFAPWTQGPTLSTLQPGDTIVVTFRGGAAGPLKVWYGDQVTVSHVTIHGANSWAVQMHQSSNSVVEHVRVEPRPGMLIGSSADGIHFSYGRSNNHIRNSYVTATVDDALVMQSLLLGKVTSQPSATQLVVTRMAFERFPNEVAVNFVDQATGAEIGGATIKAQDPPDVVQPSFGGTVTLTMSHALPNLPPGTAMVYAAPNMRGAGSTITDNVVDGLLMGRGIWIGGSRGVTIERNVIRGTSSGAVVLFQDTVNDVGPPAHDIVIRNNSFQSNLGPMASGSLTQTAMAAVVVETVLPPNFPFSTEPVNSNISVVGNSIVDSGRGGVWMGNTNGGTIANNRIASWYQEPALPIFAVPPQLQQQVLQDISQPIVVRYSSGVTTAGNVTGCAVFTDDPPVARATTVRAIHLIELRACVDAARTRHGLPVYAYRDQFATAGVTLIRAEHIVELRAALAEAYAAAKLTPPVFAEAIVPGKTPVRAVHMFELRAAMAALNPLLQ
jgi:hypothetical protein